MDLTNKLKLCVISREDDMIVGDFFQRLAGSSEDSNMNLIDRAVKSLQSAHLTTDDYDPDNEIKNAGGLIEWFRSNFTPPIVYKLDPVTDIQTIIGSGETYFKWQDPSDYIEHGVTLGVYGGTLLVRNDNHFPADEADGELILDSTTRNAYKNTYYRDSGLVNGNDYFYRFFPYTTAGIYSYDNASGIQLSPRPIALDNVINLSVASAGNGKLNIQWTDPNSIVQENGITLATWASTTILVKSGSYALNKDDNNVEFSMVVTDYNKYSRTPLTVSGLENGITYYISIFPTTTAGDVTMSDLNRATGTPVRFKIPVKPSQTNELVYTGSSLSPTWSGYDSYTMKLSGVTSAVNAGTYTATFTPLTDYCWDDGSVDPINIDWTIAKSSKHGFTLNTTNIELNTSSPTASVTASRAGDGAIVAVVSDKDIASASVNGTTITISGVDQNEGSTIIYVYLGEGTNYTAATDPIIINVSASYLPPIGTSLDDCTWDQISEIASRGLARNYFNIGDLKAIDINGTVGELSINGTYYAFILGFDHNGATNTIDFSLCANSSGTPLTFVDSEYNSGNGAYNPKTKCFSMNHWGSVSSFLGQITSASRNYGGWKGCDLRYDILGSTDIAPTGYNEGSSPDSTRAGHDATITCATNPVPGTLMAALPDSLRVNMKPMTIYTHNSVGGSSNGSGSRSDVTSSVDYLPLLSEYEVKGKISIGNSYESEYQQQYEYFADNNSALRYSHSNSSSARRYFLRSVANQYTFTYISTTNSSSSSGEAAIGNFYSSESEGISPIFRI